VRLLIVTHFFPEHGGGIEIVAGQLATRFGARGATVEWVATDEGPTRAIGAHPVRGWNPLETPLGVPYPLWGPAALSSLWSAVKRCDLAHLHDGLYASSLAAATFLRLHRKPFVLTQHVGVVPYRNALLRGAMHAGNRRLAGTVMRQASQTVFCSSTTERYFTDLLGPMPHRMIANGVDLQVFHPGHGGRQALRDDFGWPADRAVCLFVGRYVEKKGIRVLRALAQRLPHVLWVFAGRGPDDPAGWGFENVVSLGTLPANRLARLYCASDLFVLPSVGEGFPLVVQESMACGTPVVVSNDTALAYPRLDAIAWHAEPTVPAFLEVVQRALADPDRGDGRRRRAAEFAAAEWDWERCAGEYWELLEATKRAGVSTDV
jgi:glycosyltransferase involved in cell wall biosynthesis